MKFNIKKWKRIWNKDNTNIDNTYNDVWEDLGIYNVSLNDSGDSQMGIIKNDKEEIYLKGIFRTEMHDDYFEIAGFFSKNDDYFDIRCYNV